MDRLIFEIYAFVPLSDNISTTYCNQAQLSNLSSSNPNLADTKSSDNPNTGTLDDATCTSIVRPEICDNGIDDDLDGNIDCDDSDCNGLPTINQISRGH